jgi:hypothetical protein
MTKQTPAYKPGDTITMGTDTYHTIKRVTRTHYEMQSGVYMPIKLVDRFWIPASLEGEIED